MSPPPSPTEPLSLTPEELDGRLQAGDDLQLVDVREAQELALARLPYPVAHLPLSRSREWISEVETLLRRDRPVVVLCHAGVRSWQFACWLMEAQGYREVWNLQGGIDAWSVRVDPSIPRY